MSDYDREMTIELRVERAIDRLDARFMADNSPMTQAEYDAKIKAIHAWAERKVRERGDIGFPDFERVEG